MKPIIEPVAKELLLAELTDDKFVRQTNNGNKEIYIFTAHDSPNLMLELGRLRELTFREAGGGTGKELDIDEFDTADNPFKQLIVWDPNEQEMVGGYRYIECGLLGKREDGQPHSPTSRLFQFSNQFMENYLSSTIELGRSFVQPLYQISYNIRKGIYSLDNLWDGLGAVYIDNPDTKYFFGKITMYPDFEARARDMILLFLMKYFPDHENLVRPYNALQMDSDKAEIMALFNTGSYDSDYKVLMKAVRNCHENIPPLMNAYMNLSPTMKFFGTAVNPHFGAVEESGILITLDDVYDIKLDRHVSSYKKCKGKREL